MAEGRKHKSLSFPFALSSEGSLVHISDFKKGTAISCPGCSAEFIARQGQKVRHHFAHKAKSNCQPESVLHATAKQLVADSFEKSLSDSTKYVFRWRCSTCGEPREVDVTSIATTVRAEHSGIEGVRSDLFFEGRRPFALEIVVSHKPEPETLARYGQAGVVVFECWPQWDTVHELVFGVGCELAHFDKPSGCATCTRRREGLAAARAVFQNLRKQLWTPSCDETPVVPWSADRHGQPIYGTALQRVLREARLLTRYGFYQAKNKPWLLYLPLENNWTIYADYGGEVWRDPTPMLYCGDRRAKNSGQDEDNVDPVEFGIYWALQAFVSRSGVDAHLTQESYLRHHSMASVGLEPTWNQAVEEWLLPCPFS